MAGRAPGPVRSAATTGRPGATPGADHRRAVCGYRPSADEGLRQPAGHVAGHTGSKCRGRDVRQARGQAGVEQLALTMERGRPGPCPGFQWCRSRVVARPISTWTVSVELTLSGLPRTPQEQSGRRWPQGFRDGLGTDQHPVGSTGSEDKPELRVEGPAGIGGCVHHDRSYGRALFAGVQNALECIDEQHLTETTAVERAVQRQLRQQSRRNRIGNASPDATGRLSSGDRVSAQRVVPDHR